MSKKDSFSKSETEALIAIAVAGVTRDLKRERDFLQRACAKRSDAIEKAIGTLQRIEYDTVKMGPTVCAEVCADLRAALCPLPNNQP